MGLIYGALILVLLIVIGTALLMMKPKDLTGEPEYDVFGSPVEKYNGVKELYQIIGTFLVIGGSFALVVWVLFETFGLFFFL